MDAQQSLEQLATSLGIEPFFYDIWGKRYDVSPELKEHIVRAMGFAPPWTEALERFLQEQNPPTPPVVVWTGLVLPDLELCLPASTKTIDWRIEAEDGTPYKGQASLEKNMRHLGQTPYGLRFAWTLPQALPWGYHKLFINAHGITHETTLVHGPERCYLPDNLQPFFGILTQLYSLQSTRNWGVGDLADLDSLIDIARRHHAQFIGLNPLHALSLDDPSENSPYFPQTRLFEHRLYLAPEWLPGYDPSLYPQNEIETLRQKPLVDYAQVIALKKHLFEEIWKKTGPDYRTELQRYGEQQPLAKSYATFLALGHHFRQHDSALWGWPVWPKPYQDARSPEVAAFAQQNEDNVLYELFLIKAMEDQLDRILKTAEEKLGVGLYFDLAVGVPKKSFDCWISKDVYALHAAIGAPPDEFNPHGQSWGLVPMNPWALKKAAYRPFIDTIRPNLHHADILRYDHVMALQRLYWTLDGQGTYINYPFTDLRTIVALESSREKTMVIGEDLGTVPEGFRETLLASGILSYRLLYFERHWQGDKQFALPQEYPKQAAVAIGTHDLPPLASFWQGKDILLRASLNILPTGKTVEDEQTERRQLKAMLLEALRKTGLWSEPGSDAPFTPDLAAALHAFLAKSPALALLVQVEDLLGLEEQVNLPGTVELYPNWRKKLPLEMHDLDTSQFWQAIIKMIAHFRA